MVRGRMRVDWTTLSLLATEPPRRVEYRGGNPVSFIQRVVGSIPTALTNKNKGLTDFARTGGPVWLIRG